MNRKRLCRLILAAMIGAAGVAACGLDGITGKVIQIDGEWYLIRTMGGDEVSVHVDQRSRKDVVAVGDQVHVYVSKSGHAEFVQKLD